MRHEAQAEAVASTRLVATACATSAPTRAGSRGDPTGRSPGAAGRGNRMRRAREGREGAFSGRPCRHAVWQGGWSDLRVDASRSMEHHYDGSANDDLDEPQPSGAAGNPGRPAGLRRSRPRASRVRIRRGLRTMAKLVKQRRKMRLAREAGSDRRTGPSMCRAISRAFMPQHLGEPPMLGGNGGKRIEIDAGDERCVEEHVCHEDARPAEDPQTGSMPTDRIPAASHPRVHRPIRRRRRRRSPA